MRVRVHGEPVRVGEYEGTRASRRGAGLSAGAVDGVWGDGGGGGEMVRSQKMVGRLCGEVRCPSLQVPSSRNHSTGLSGSFLVTGAAAVGHMWAAELRGRDTSKKTWGPGGCSDPDQPSAPSLLEFEELGDSSRNGVTPGGPSGDSLHRGFHGRRNVASTWEVPSTSWSSADLARELP